MPFRSRVDSLEEHTKRIGHNYRGKRIVKVCFPRVMMSEFPLMLFQPFLVQGERYIEVQD